MGWDFQLRRFRKYLVCSFLDNTLVTDHKTLYPIFKSNRKDSIQAEKIKMSHQDIRYKVVYQKGKLKEADYILRKRKPYIYLITEEQEEINNLSNFIYILHVAPVTSYIWKKIAKHTKKNSTLKELSKMLHQGRMWLPRDVPSNVLRFDRTLLNWWKHPLDWFWKVPRASSFQRVCSRRQLS